MKQKQIFISYKSEEFDEALWVKESLEAQGFTCWMAPMSITGGASYAAEIPAAIRSCTVFVLILSQKVQQSKWVSRELDQAINDGKTIMPFMLENCPLNDEFKFYLSNIQRYYAYQDKLGAFQKMSMEIRTILGIPEPEPEPAPEPKPAPPPKPEPVKKVKKKRVLPIILSAVAAAILLPILLVIIIGSSSKVTFGNTKFRKHAHYIEVEDQTITAKDLQALTTFKDLSSVAANNCAFETDDLSIFGTLDLQSLELKNCSLTDDQLNSIGFDQMDSLYTLDLSNNTELTAIDPLVPVADTLTSLSIGNTGIRNITKLEQFTRLTSLSIENLGLTSLKPLTMLVYLDTLVADNNQFINLNGLENTTILQTVSLNDNRLQDVTPLANSSATLHKLYLNNNALIDLACLETCTGIVEFSADGNLLTSMSFIANWNSVRRFSAAHNQIRYATAPTSAALIYLDLSRNNLTDFSGFVFGDSYVTLDLSDNDLVFVTLPISFQYNYLALHGNPLKRIPLVAATAQGFTLSIDYWDGISVESIETITANTFYIIDCPPNRIVELEQASCNVQLLNRSDIPTTIKKPPFSEF